MFTLAVASGGGMPLSDSLAPGKFLCPEADRLGPPRELQPLPVAGLVVVGPVPISDFPSLDGIGDPILFGVLDAPSHFQLSDLVRCRVAHLCCSLFRSCQRVLYHTPVPPSTLAVAVGVVPVVEPAGAVAGRLRLLSLHAVGLVGLTLGDASLVGVPSLASQFPVL